MATKLLGTAANNSLLAIKYSGGADLLDADIATMVAAIFDDTYGAFGRIAYNAWSRSGQLYLPNRGGQPIQMKPGDWLAIDTNSGWPIVISANVVDRGGTPWVHT
jgi:hypothetical protein